MRAAIFDLDGTLVDNMSVHADAWVALSTRHGAAVSRDRFLLEFAGRKNEEIIADLWPGRDRAFAVALADEKEALYRELYRPRLAPLPGLLALLDALESAGVLLAIASAGPALNRALVLDGLGLRRRFQKVIGAEDAKRGKPFPDIFLAAAAALGVLPGECVAFEDALLGVQAAVAAGMATAAVTTSQPEAALRQSGARWVMPDFTELPKELKSALGV
jgi:HAD superfamily hydrolase (TIGR01509 family)